MARQPDKPPHTKSAEDLSEALSGGKRDPTLKDFRLCAIISISNFISFDVPLAIKIQMRRTELIRT